MINNNGDNVLIKITINNNEPTFYTPNLADFTLEKLNYNLEEVNEEHFTNLDTDVGICFDGIDGQCYNNISKEACKTWAKNKILSDNDFEKVYTKDAICGFCNDSSSDGNCGACLDGISGQCYDNILEGKAISKNSGCRSWAKNKILSDEEFKDVYFEGVKCSDLLNDNDCHYPCGYEDKWNNKNYCYKSKNYQERDTEWKYCIKNKNIYEKCNNWIGSANKIEENISDECLRILWNREGCSGIYIDDSSSLSFRNWVSQNTLKNMVDDNKNWRYSKNCGVHGIISSTNKPILTTKPLIDSTISTKTKPLIDSTISTTTKPLVTTKPLIDPIISTTTKPLVTTKPLIDPIISTTTKPLVTTKPLNTKSILNKKDPIVKFEDGVVNCNDGEICRYIKISNLKKFKKYSFRLKYSTKFENYESEFSDILIFKTKCQKDILKANEECRNVCNGLSCGPTEDDPVVNEEKKDTSVIFGWPYYKKHLQSSNKCGCYELSISDKNCCNQISKK